MPGWAVCWRAGLGDLMGLWPGLSALSRDPGLFLRAACAPRVCCVFVPLRNAAQSPQLLINLHGEPWASKHHPPAPVDGLSIKSFYLLLVLMDLGCLCAAVSSSQPWAFPEDLHAHKTRTEVSMSVGSTWEVCEGESVSWDDCLALRWLKMWHEGTGMQFTALRVEVLWVHSHSVTTLCLTAGS